MALDLFKQLLEKDDGIEAALKSMDKRDKAAEENKEKEEKLAAKDEAIKAKEDEGPQDDKAAYRGKKLDPKIFTAKREYKTIHFMRPVYFHGGKLIFGVAATQFEQTNPDAKDFLVHPRGSSGKLMSSADGSWKDDKGHTFSHEMLDKMTKFKVADII